MNRNALQQMMPLPKLSQKIAVTVTPADSAPLPNNIAGVLLYATQDMYVEWGATAEPTGTVAGAKTTGLSMFLPLGKERYFAVPPTDSTSSTGHVLNAVRSSADGLLFITPLSP